MSAFASPIACYLELCRSDDTENAFCGLTELDHEALPELRAFLLNVIWEHRQTSAIPLLGEALQEGKRPVWRQAMDGLVALACPEALGNPEVLAELRSAKTRAFPRQHDTEEFRAWLEEAIDQVTQGFGQ